MANEIRFEANFYNHSLRIVVVKTTHEETDEDPEYIIRIYLNGDRIDSVTIAINESDARDFVQQLIRAIKR